MNDESLLNFDRGKFFLSQGFTHLNQVLVFQDEDGPRVMLLSTDKSGKQSIYIAYISAALHHTAGAWHNLSLPPGFDS
jgi:hypothetical protein